MTEFIIGGIFVLILVACALVGLKKGFIRMIAGFLEYVVSFFAAYVFCARISVAVKRLPFLQKMITDIEMPSFDEGTGLMEKAKTIISFLVQTLIKGENAEEYARAMARNYLASAIATVISFIGIFIVALLIQKLIVWIIDSVAKVPVLRETNKTLGLIFGLFCGSFWTWLVANVFSKLLPFLSEKFPTVFSESLAESPIMVFFLRINPVSLLLNALAWVADKLTIN